MRLSAKTFSAMLIALALAAFQFDSYAQSRGNSRSTSTSRSSSSSRPSSSSSSSSSSRSSSSSSSSSVSRSSSKSSAVSKPSSSRGSSSAARPSSPSVSKPSDKPSGSVSAGRPSGQPSSNVSSSRPSGNNNGATVSRPGNVSRPKPDISPADRNPDRPSVNKPSGNKPSMNKPAPNRPVARPENRPKPGAPKPDFKPGNHNKPIHVHRPAPHPRPERVHPRDRDFMHYSKPSYHWANTPHYYGYRVKILPVNARRHLYRGVTYYIYDNVWYRSYNGYYVVCRPPFGTSLAANLIADMAWTAVTISYYNTVANTFRTINENNAYIAQQNAVIAQNNATIAAQNQAIAQSQQRAATAYGLADKLGLVQSYAAADASYYYQDGVFYSVGADGQYYVIVPPAGAMVDRLPEDFDVVMLDGNKYYRVDDTVYQMIINEGKPYFEVLGQMN